MRKALIVGINFYEHGSTLYGCVDDAHSVKSVLERNSDGTVNFGVKLLTGTGPTDLVLRSELSKFKVCSQMTVRSHSSILLDMGT